ncbi:hypothetical protein ACFL4W_04685 [Planctomycetota bacterium]
MPQTRDIRNASSFLWGFPTCEQREVVIILDAAGKAAWHGRSRSCLPQIEAQMKKVLPKAKGLLHGLDLPAKYKADIINSYRHGQLAEVEIHAFKMSRNKAWHATAKELADRIAQDRTARTEEIQALFEAQKINQMLIEIDAFLDAYPKAKEGRELKQLVLKARKDKTTREMVAAKDLYDKVIAAWSKNQQAKPKEAGQLLKRYPDSYWARLLAFLWVENNNKAGKAGEK